VTYYILKVFSWLGIVWDLREVPESVYAEKFQGLESVLES
jgi:hypothetical protein